MGLRGLPSKAWQVNTGWVIAANIAADLAAWTRLLGHCDDAGLRDADPDTLRYRAWHIPARLARHARQRTLAISPDWPWADAFLDLLAQALRPARTRLTSTNHPSQRERRTTPAQSEPVRTRAHREHRAPPTQRETDIRLKNGTSTISNRTSNRLND